MVEHDSEFEALLDYLKRSRSFDFTGYKRPSLMRRVRVQMSALGIDNYADYTSRLEADPDEVKNLLNMILINVTGFFRDASAWEVLQTKIIPDIIAGKPPAAPIRIWSAGCATGEEAYSLAILFAEALGLDQFTRRVRIHATDLDDAALNYARQAAYPTQKMTGMPPEYTEKYFDRVGDRYVLNKNLRRAVIFGRHDLTQDVPISRLDLLSCRNTLMYLNSDVQTSVLSRFHFALNEGGYLFLGKAEMLIARNKLFSPVDLKRRIFIKTRNGNDRERLQFFTPVVEEPMNISAATNFQQMSFQTSPFAQFAVNREGILVLSNERANSLFRLTARDIGQVFPNLEISYRPAELRPLISQVLSERKPHILEDIAWNRADGEKKFFTVQVIPIPRPDVEPVGVCVTFVDITAFTERCIKNLYCWLDESCFEKGVNHSWCLTHTAQGQM